MGEVLERKAAEFAKIVNRPTEQVLAELESYIRAGEDPRSAIAKWKSEPANKFALGAGKIQWTGRVIAVEEPRTQAFEDRQSSVTNYHFAVRDPDTPNEIVFKSGSVWGDERIEEFNQLLQVPKVYTFKAGVKEDGSLT